MADEITPLMVEHGRPFVEVHLPEAGTRAVAWIDTGGFPVIVGHRLAAALGEVTVPEMRIAGRKLGTSGIVGRTSDQDLIAAGFPAELFVPAGVLANHHVVLDYPARTFGVDSGHLPAGVSASARSGPRPPWPVITVSLGGEQVHLLLDTGASCSMVTDRLAERLERAVVSRVRGAFGLANMGAGAWEAGVETVAIRDFSWAGIDLPQLVAVTRPTSAFSETMSSGTPVPVEGAIAGNLLRHLRVEWKAAEQTVWVSHEGVPSPSLRQVGLVIHLEGAAARVVGASVAALAAGARGGDEIVAVDDEPIEPGSFGSIVASLEGAEDEVRRVAVRRDGELVELALVVEALLSI